MIKPIEVLRHAGVSSPHANSFDSAHAHVHLPSRIDATGNGARVPYFRNSTVNICVHLLAISIVIA